jgi:hypothetical protein
MHKMPKCTKQIIMPYLSTFGQLGEYWIFKSWGMKTCLFESWTFNSLDLLKYGIIGSIVMNFGSKSLFGE